MTLNEKNIGDIVKIKENGVYVNYIVVQKGKPSSLYDNSCDGVWLLREKAHSKRAWHGTSTSTSVNDYENSDIEAWLNGDFLNTIDSKIRAAIKTVKIPYRKGSGTSKTVQSGENGLSCKVFLLSGYEIGYTQSGNQFLPIDGAKLSYFSDNNSRIGKDSTDSAVFWWLRSPFTSYATDVFIVFSGGSLYRDFSYFSSVAVRPAMILPYESVLEDDIITGELGESSGNIIVKLPYLNISTFDYSGTNISPTIVNYNGLSMTASGTLSGVAAGKYQIIVSLVDTETTMWEDGTTDDIILEWEIKPVAIAKPTVTPLSLEYNGSNQSVTISEYNSALVVKTGTETAKSAGIYNVIFSLKDPSSSAWDNGDGTATTDDIIIEWEITKKICKIPALKTTEFTYNGYYCAPTLDENYNSILMNCTGVTNAYNAGEYNVVVSLRDTTSTEWEDGTTENKTLNWKINKRIDKLGFPTISPTEFIFNNVRQAPLVTWGTNSNSNLISISGTTSAITACVDEPYKIIFSLKQNNNNITYVWEDDTTDDYILTWCINKAILPLPTIEKDTFEYNGKNITANVSSYDANLVTRTGTISVANAKVGEYSVYYSLRDNASSEWEDGTIEDKKIIWSNK